MHFLISLSISRWPVHSSLNLLGRHSVILQSKPGLFNVCDDNEFPDHVWWLEEKLEWALSSYLEIPQKYCHPFTLKPDKKHPDIESLYQELKSLRSRAS